MTQHASPCGSALLPCRAHIPLCHAASCMCTQAVAAVILCEGVTHVQLHDYHGGMSLLHLPEQQRPRVLYVAHNAHYNAQFPVPSTARRLKVTMMLGLGALNMTPCRTTPCFQQDCKGALHPNGAALTPTGQDPVPSLCAVVSHWCWLCTGGRHVTEVAQLRRWL